MFCNFSCKYQAVQQWEKEGTKCLLIPLKGRAGNRVLAFPQQHSVTDSCQSNKVKFLIWGDLGAFTREVFAGAILQPCSCFAKVRCCSPEQGEGGRTHPAADAGLAGTASFQRAGSFLGREVKHFAALA